MTRTLWLRPAVIVLAVAIPAGLGRAQTVPAAAAPAPAPAVPLPPAPPLEAVPAPAPGTTPDGRWYPYGPLEIQEVASTAPPRRQPVRSALRFFNLCCWSDINHVGCGSFKSEATYIFGSCRDFYKEQCEPPPPHPWFRAPAGPAEGCHCGD